MSTLLETSASRQSRLRADKPCRPAAIPSLPFYQTYKHQIHRSERALTPSTDMRRDVQGIFMQTPHHKQVMMFSATLSKDVRAVCKKFMSNVSLFTYSIAS